ncbi:beta-class carbonic anhydrase [Virgibacillus oceani]|uniref:carbonic anhydrase n=1 Tax=Virgibacillus oceani TaxID=1479511 RepID=A0A917MB34_9BACI|nr:carbonic anhydrase [Virgibacillus oceani]GGG86432.1 carbonic anhydrase [Virgibacillus oceani]
MTLLDEILAYNEKFVENKEYEAYQTGKLPNKKLVILSCMDTRLVELLPKSMNLRNGDVKMVKNGGALVEEPFGSTMKSILVGVYALTAEEVCVVGHHDCGMTGVKPENMLEKVKERGISQEKLDTLHSAGVDLEQFLNGIDNVEDSVRNSVSTIRSHPLMPKNVAVHGLVIDPATGKLDLVVNGYEK